MKCLIGLGNPGRKYKETRHNTGFRVIDKVAEHFHVEISQKKFNGLYVKFKHEGQDILLLKPCTFMNLSGESVSSFVNYYKINLKDILIIMDDLDLPVGRIRVKRSGSDGGQRGLRNIIHHLGTQRLNRLRVGIDNNKLIDTADYVLGKVEPEKMELYLDSLERAKLCAIDFITTDISDLMNKYNSNGITIDELV